VNYQVSLVDHKFRAGLPKLSLLPLWNFGRTRIRYVSLLWMVIPEFPEAYRNQSPLDFLAQKLKGRSHLDIVLPKKETSRVRLSLDRKYLHPKKVTVVYNWRL